MLRLAPLWRGVGMGLILFVIWQSLKRDPIDVPMQGGDRVGHLIAYASIMWWHCQLETAPARQRLLGLVFVGMGVALEIAQSFTGYRTMDATDALANGVGVVLGWLVSPPRLPRLIVRLDQALWRLLGRA